eukprot:TRINITY_DN2750_c0_g1_i2.p1 TRINITY_DN2750_c0_g1~~TRINITY_DN2750_c0_g1_i2.p1  ORF type:complete len:455 (-),score=115.45 TRINITY_DN2750_c0_g1_i2:218-1582(-)
MESSDIEPNSVNPSGKIELQEKTSSVKVVEDVKIIITIIKGHEKTVDAKTIQERILKTFIEAQEALSSNIEAESKHSERITSLETKCKEINSCYEEQKEMNEKLNAIHSMKLEELAKAEHKLVENETQLNKLQVETEMQKVELGKREARLKEQEEEIKGIQNELKDNKTKTEKAAAIEQIDAKLKEDLDKLLTELSSVKGLLQDEIGKGNQLAEEIKLQKEKEIAEKKKYANDYKELVKKLEDNPQHILSLAAIKVFGSFSAMMSDGAESKANCELENCLTLLHELIPSPKTEKAASRNNEDMADFLADEKNPRSLSHKNLNEEELVKLSEEERAVLRDALGENAVKYHSEKGAKLFPPAFTPVLDSKKDSLRNSTILKGKTSESKKPIENPHAKTLGYGGFNKGYVMQVYTPYTKKEKRVFRSLSPAWWEIYSHQGYQREGSQSEASIQNHDR